MLDPGEAGVLLGHAWRTFHRGLADGGSDRLFDPLGEGWGPYADSTELTNGDGASGPGSAIRIRGRRCGRASSPGRGR